MTREEEFAEWLRKDSEQTFRVSEKGRTTVVIKAMKNKDFTYLYTQDDYNDNGMRRGAVFEYAGIYYKGDGKLYDTDWRLRDIVPQIAQNKASDMKDAIASNVRKRVEQYLDNNKNNLAERELSPKYAEDLGYFRKYSSQDRVRNLFLQDVTSDAVVYECPYKFDVWSENSLLQYIANPEDFEKKQADTYIAEHQQDMLLDIEENEFIREELRKIEALEDSPMHRLKNIMETMRKSEARTVEVTLNKNGQMFTCKMEADRLRGVPYKGIYSMHGMATESRVAFENVYGRSAQFGPEDITDISYRKKSIYSAEPLAVEQAETAGLIITQ